ncbi:MAG TPA: hemerythrin domain-containing protein [Burkholderiales bacterium]|nr:hemerythrin domain-containing protein [Burkholderiales bacterium]
MSEKSSRPMDFSRPLDSLKTCHVRIRSECGKLRDLAERVKDGQCDEEARTVAAALMRYFDTAARFHHEDEEEDLLPRMMAAATIGRGSRLTRMVADIATEHREMDRLWTELRAGLQELSAGEKLPLNLLSVDRFVKLYASHITVEETNVYPLAEMLLSKEDLDQIGASMAERRGAKDK